MPGVGYGENIVKLWNAAKAVVAPVTPTASAPAVPSDWAVESWAWAKQSGITDGRNPRGNITREQVACMLHRFSKL
ncbi:hypothetical protein FACS189490_03260 [Clostridia bacterium]|nr:hypothetical protein FACS189490_03260 [Clostridia bacterium]